MKKILIIVPDGGMLFESAGIADILMQANRLHPEGAREICYQVKLATTQPHQVIHGQSGLNLLADHRLHEIDPREPLDTIMFSRYNLQQTATQGPINDLLAWLLENLTADLSVDKLAEKVAMSPRNFTRVFTRETGASPARYVAEARLAAARQRLEQTHETLDRIAEQTGFGSSINLRRLFEKQLNLTPGEYRQRFHCRKMA
ncbi:TPA: helix-turn-helix domain-containing protein [Klebsiella pneumoniae]|uniref:helix-turn-helix domain-containing protein n=1 Tax=Klebsiella pneumoniae TaxID=573 RepID=UPI00186765F6|nr:helix-turn-helix domain-containing protein [Klebsiella pneumoniae]MDI7013563.1 helix-turn-helix domain-containing protein [Klebsiella pneumoniae]MDI7063116.1 helix-turn-helix domain-containing protein [Klebsiella pneumoniae]MDI7101619.1 helix-turn-helix domain-containing protein [Klebsiella pneumoniae]MDI7148047.1 helix-turn-helix domain-containing protein [Klebsiella pneumoniae]UGR02388.1 helix-turn-helix domain-containing protein [Klebsiella pneumoniae]